MLCNESFKFVRGFLADIGKKVNKNQLDIITKNDLLAKVTNTQEHNLEIAKQVDILLEREVIEVSTAEYYSQVVLARKADQTWQ